MAISFRWLFGSCGAERGARGRNDHLIESGYLDVGDGHEIYFEQWGNAAGIPIVVLHGGPGGAFNATFKTLFDPKRHRILLFDQRGCGQSRPAGRLESNTTADLIADINRLRERTGLRGPINLAGGSWGSTLALVYAEQYPENVKELMLWSTFLATRKEIDDPLAAQTLDRKFPHPRAWRQFIRLIPRAQRKDPQKIIDYALSVFNSRDAAKARALAIAYIVYDLATCNSPNFSESRARAEAASDPNIVQSVHIQLEYFKHGCFIAENEIIDRVEEIRGIKATVAHGLDDWCTRPKASDDLRRAYGPNMTVQYVKSGHLRTDPEMTKALRAIASQLS